MGQRFMRNKTILFLCGDLKKANKIFEDKIFYLYCCN